MDPDQHDADQDQIQAQQEAAEVKYRDLTPGHFADSFRDSCSFLGCGVPAQTYCSDKHRHEADNWSKKTSAYHVCGGFASNKRELICSESLILKAERRITGIPELATEQVFQTVPWENPRVFNCDILENEVNRDFLFFANPPATFTEMSNSQHYSLKWKSNAKLTRFVDGGKEITVTSMSLRNRNEDTPKAGVPPGWRLIRLNYRNQDLFCICYTRNDDVAVAKPAQSHQDSKGAGQGKKDDTDGKGKGDKKAVAKKQKRSDGAKVPGTSSSDPVAATEEFMPSEVSLQSLDTEQSLMNPTSELEAASENGDKSEDTDSEEKDQAVDGLSSDLNSIGLEDSVAHAVEAEESNDAAAFAVDNGADFFNNFPAKPHTPASTSATAKDFMPPESSDPVFDDAIQRALVVGYYKEAVDQCISANKMADALVIAHVGGTALWESTREKYLRASSAPHMKVVSAMMKNDHLTSLVSTRSHKFWKETLALLSAVFAQGEEWAVPCDALASKLMDAGNTLAAVLCYLGAGNVDRTVERSLANERDGRSYAEHLQDLMEKTLVLALATGNKRFSTSLCKLFESYAEMLASQGLLTTEMKYLKVLDSGGLSTELSVLRDRIALSAEPETDTAAPDNTQPQSTVPYSQQSSPPAHESSAQPSMTTTFVPLTPPALTRFFDETSEALGGVEKHDTGKVSLCL